MNKEHSVVNTKPKLTIETQIFSWLWLITFDLLHQVGECFDLLCLTCVVCFSTYQDIHRQYNVCMAHNSNSPIILGLKSPDHTGVKKMPDHTVAFEARSYWGEDNNYTRCVLYFYSECTLQVFSK
jgi:hypothetical protein